VVPRAQSLQDAARFRIQDRSYFAKYPGHVGGGIRALTEEMLQRIATHQAAATAA
jgi:hypothetical protein